MTTRKAPAPRTLVAEALRSGDRHESLVALRDQLAERLDGTTSARDAATITRQLAAIVSVLDDIDKGTSNRAQARAKREARRVAARAAAAGVEPSAGNAKSTAARDGGAVG